MKQPDAVTVRSEPPSFAIGGSEHTRDVSLVFWSRPNSTSAFNVQGKLRRIRGPELPALR